MLQASDGVAVELAATLPSDYRKDQTRFNSGRLGVLQRALSAIGRTPVDRSRMAAPTDPVDPNDPWAKLAAGSFGSKEDL